MWDQTYTMLTARRGIAMPKRAGACASRFELLFLLATLCSTYGVAAGAGAAAAPSISYAQAPNYTAFDCSRYDPTYTQIDADLEIHRKLGTSFNATKYIAARLGNSHMRGLTVGFFGGRAYLLIPTVWDGLGHHAPLHLAYVRMLLHVEATFGRHIPDVVFVLTTSDTPRYMSPRVVNSSSPDPRLPERLAVNRNVSPGPYPVMGIGKSDHYPDLLLVPNFHFHMKMYDQSLLANVPAFNATPWSGRKPVLFGRFSRYRTNRNPNDTYTIVRGIGGRSFCYNGGASCAVREHFVKYVAERNRARIDVSFGGKWKMAAHAQFKYLASLDGQGISSRLEQLLPLGSLVFKQASGYYAYYYRSLLRHRVNVIEFWQRGPEDVLEQLDWAAKHDAEAAAIAAEGMRVAATYLTGNGRTCYWYRVLHGLHGTLTYTPSLSEWPHAAPLRDLVEVQLPSSEYGRRIQAEPWAP